MTDEQLIAKLLEMLEHPEQVTDEQLRQMLDDEEMHELVEQMAFTKRAFKNEESLTEGLPIADEWEKFAASHAEELTNAARAEGKFTCTMPCKEEEDESQLDAFGEGKAQPHFSISYSPFRKIAACFIGILVVSGIALAAIHIWRFTPDSSPKDESPILTSSKGEETSSTMEISNELQTDTLIFDNVPLDTMLLAMADYYHVSVEFEREEVRQLRFHFVWKRTDDLDRLMKKLNTFEAVNIIREPQKLIVK